MALGVAGVGLIILFITEPNVATFSAAFIFLPIFLDAVKAARQLYEREDFLANCTGNWTPVCLALAARNTARFKNIIKFGCRLSLPVNQSQTSFYKIFKQHATDNDRHEMYAALKEYTKRRRNLHHFFRTISIIFLIRKNGVAETEISIMGYYISCIFSDEILWNILAQLFDGYNKNLMLEICSAIRNCVDMDNPDRVVHELRNLENQINVYLPFLNTYDDLNIEAKPDYDLSKISSLIYSSAYLNNLEILHGELNNANPLLNVPYGLYFAEEQCELINFTYLKEKPMITDDVCTRFNELNKKTLLVGGGLVGGALFSGFTYAFFCCSAPYIAVPIIAANLVIASHSKDNYYYRTDSFTQRGIRFMENGFQNFMYEKVEPALDNGFNKMLPQSDLHDPNEWPPLFFAAARGNIDVAKLLLEYGADPKFIAQGSVNFLDVALNFGHRDFYRVMKDITEEDSVNDFDRLTSKRHPKI